MDLVEQLFLLFKQFGVIRNLWLCFEDMFDDDETVLYSSAINCLIKMNICVDFAFSVNWDAVSMWLN